MKRRKRRQQTRGPDQQPRAMQPASLANLKPIDAVLDGKESVVARLRLHPAEARAWRRLDPSERGRLVEMALNLRETEG